ncbi:MAG TPA: XRE family transcriptional regulator [Phascolarctobacterium succinatutens]|jgi:transcriptional regulator with XRE-family HTH domain|uniref:helix-turn-helix domain-containing protein n=1 Tax=Phascolarctobacterium succinatutens TaxID=626940 RepID=UPI000EC1BF0F|nr:helix-turn-helix transcriptional regulator [Phascolarctobacterium succinatutens]HAM92855.1 XRE family transcriptional regulator [Phascolarctobacterium succinatutens]
MKKKVERDLTKDFVKLDLTQDLKELGVLLGSHRTALGIRQDDLAHFLGISRITLSRIENNRLPLSMELFLRIAAVLELRPEYLLQELTRVTQRKWSRKGED